MAGFDGKLTRAGDKERRASTRSAKYVRPAEIHQHHLRSSVSYPGASGEDQSNPEEGWYTKAGSTNIHFHGDVTNLQIGSNNTMHVHQNSVKCTYTKQKTQTKPDGKKPKKNFSEDEKRKYAELKVCRTEVTQEHMLTLCKKIGKRWRHYGRKLGLSDEDLEYIHDSDNGLREIVYKMLTAWKQKSENVSVGELVTLLTNDGDISVIIDLIRDT